MPIRRTISSRRLPRVKLWIFRFLAVIVPTAIGMYLLYCLMVQRHFLVPGSPTSGIKVQRPLFLQEPGFEATGHRYLFHQEFGWRNIPNWQATTHGKSLTINSHGFRGEDFVFQKDPNVTRLLVLGDSFTWGYGVADDEVFCHVLEDALRDRIAERDWHVINTGVSGWGTDQQYLYLRSEGFDYTPDMVVLAFFIMNDPVENVSSRQYGMNKPLFVDLNLTLGNVPVPKPHLSPYFAQRQDPIKMTLAIIRAMHDACQERATPLVIMKFGRFLRPDSELLAADEKAIESEVTSWKGSLYLDLDAYFEKKGLTAQELTIGNFDGHWNAHGHRRVAEALFEFVHASDALSDGAGTK